MKDFSGKVAVITGAASGIGLALTKKCLAEGHAGCHGGHRAGCARES